MKHDNNNNFLQRLNISKTLPPRYLRLKISQVGLCYVLSPLTKQWLYVVVFPAVYKKHKHKKGSHLCRNKQFKFFFQRIYDQQRTFFFKRYINNNAHFFSEDIWTTTHILKTRKTGSCCDILTIPWMNFNEIKTKKNMIFSIILLVFFLLELFLLRLLY